MSEWKPMPSAHRQPGPADRWRERSRAAGIAGCLVVALLLAGCVDVNYDRIALGATPKEYARVLPDEQTRRTDLGLCYVGRDMSGRTDAIVVLLTPDRRVSCKVQASYFERNLGFRVDRGYRLRGELDPQLAETQSAGPIDTLRAVASDLMAYRGERLSQDAHSWVAAGLVRLIQRWPNVVDPGLETHQLSELFERVAGGGVARISVDARGVYRFEYEQGVTR